MNPLRMRMQFLYVRQNKVAWLVVFTNKENKTFSLRIAESIREY